VLPKSALGKDEGMEITTERLVLRPFTLADAPAVAALANNRRLYETLLSLPNPYSEELAKSWIATHAADFANDDRYEFAITDRVTGELYGAIGISHNKNYHKGEMGYWIGEQFWGRGFTTEAAAALIDFVFTAKGFHKVFAYHFDFNPASGRVMQKVGMNHVGTFVDNVFKDGKYITEHCYEIINPHKTLH